jgi:phosphatidylinositol alpha-mannosyltransferase
VQGQVLGLARSLRRRGHDVRVLGPCDGPPPDPGVTPLGVSIPMAANGSVAPIAPDPAAALRTIRVLRDEDFDVLHLHEPLVPGPTMTAIVVKSAPIVGTFHAAGGSPFYKWGKPGALWLARRLDVRCAVSDDARAMAEHALGGHYTVLWNGVDVDEYRDVEPWPKEGPTILFVGRHEPRKGLAILLDAMRKLPADVTLWIAGTGPDTDALRTQHAGDPRLHWLDTVSDGEKIARLVAADVFCAPSLRGESFGVVLLEAMAAGAPVVASDLPGYANVAREGRDALLVPPGDVGALATALQRALAEPDLRARLTASGHDRAEEFSMGHLAEAYLDLYQQVGAVPYN